MEQAKMQLLQRPLSISDVDFRVQSINNGGYATILAYKDARVDMNRLDEVLGPLGWQRDYKLIDGKLFCGVGIYDEKVGWVWKWDVGVESNTEKEKGQASDSFKRACFNLGIGRELYDYPVINVKLFENEWSKDGGKPRQTFELKIKEWRWYSEFTDGRISYLGAKDQLGRVRFQWGALKPRDKGSDPEYKPASGGEISAADIEPTSPIATAEEGNPAGLLKKEVTVDPDREAAVAEYVAIFGKKPHGKMSTENIRKEITEYIDNIPEESEEEEEAPETTNTMTVTAQGGFDEEGNWVDRKQEEPAAPVVEEDVEEEEEIEITFAMPTGIRSHFDEISEFTNPNEFIGWAKAKVQEFIDTDPSDAIEEFKTLCNNHYTKLVKK